MSGALGAFLRNNRLDDETITAVIKRYDQGESISAVMAEMGLSQSAFSKAIKRRGISLSKRTPAITARIAADAIRLYEEGLSQDQVARQLNIKRSTLAVHLRTNGYQARNRYETLRSKAKLSKTQVEHYHDRYLNGETVSILAAEAGLTKVALTDAFHRQGLKVRAWSRMTPSLARTIGERLQGGLSLFAISKEFGFSLSGLRQGLFRHGVTLPRVTSAAIRDFKKRLKAGTPLEALADETGLSSEGFRAVLNRHAKKVPTSRRSKVPQKAAHPSTSRARKLTDEQVNEIHRRRINERIGIPALAKEYGIGGASIYERLKKLGLAVSPKMGTARKTIPDDLVRSIYAEAKSTKKSVSQVIRERGLTDQAGGISISGRALGLVPLSASEITGHSERDTYLYIMKVTILGKAVGLYAGQSIDPIKRMRQHIEQAARCQTTRNKRTAFIKEAVREARSAGVPIETVVTIEVLAQAVVANAAAEAERDLITRIRDQCLQEDYVFLNGLIGSPAGGYGRALDANAEIEIVRAYSSGKTSQEIAFAFGVGRSTINRIIAARGQQKDRSDYLRTFDDTIISQAVSMAEAGDKQDAICKQLGLSKPTLYLALKRAGLTKAYKRRSR